MIFSLWMRMFCGLRARVYQAFMCKNYLQTFIFVYNINETNVKERRVFMGFKTKLKNAMQEKDINITDAELDMFEKYYNLLQEHNEKHNLTAIKQEDEIILKHFVDSVLPINYFTSNSRVIDLGAGAGFPSIPLKILDPSLEMTLIDSSNKKIDFLNELIDVLGLDGVSTIHTRCEDLAMLEDYRESFDFCIARALAPLNTLAEYALPFVREGGKFLSYKGVAAEEELEAAEKVIELMGGEVERVRKYKLSDGVERVVLVIKKISSTPAKYPRSQNKPRLQPI